MPAFYPRAQGASQPLTPPDSGSGYGYSSMHYPQQEAYVPHQDVAVRHDAAYDYQHSYLQPAVAPAPPSYQYQSGGFQPQTSLPPISSYYEPMGAPILPPLRMQEHMSFTDDYQRRVQQGIQEQEQQSAAIREQQRQAAKEEKATGGVSAKLDYDMDRMTDFVTHYTQKIFNQTVTSPPSFRKWVHSVLSATRLPSATILLSLHYLSERFRLHPQSIPAGENQVYRLLSVSLILGSKFLDDNTFVNKSWSDVTAIRVSELNSLERKWLQLINYILHVDPQGGVQSWLDAWKNYDEEQTARLQISTRLSPLDTNVHRHSGGRGDRYSPYPTPYTASSGRNYDTFSARSSQYSTPYTPADPWSSTERPSYNDFNKNQYRYPTLADIDAASRRDADDRRQSQSLWYGQQSAAPQSYYQPSAYASTWDAYGWNGAHRSDCNCASCAYQHYRPYAMASGYSAQSVMG